MFAFWKRPAPPKPQVTLIQREPFKLTLSEWRSNKDMTAMAAAILNNPNFKFMLQVLYNSSPAWETMLAPTLNDRAAQQARIEGYAQALANLEALGIHEPVREPLEQTFEPEEKSTE